MNEFESDEDLMNAMRTITEIYVKEEPQELNEKYHTENDMIFESFNHQSEASKIGTDVEMVCGSSFGNIEIKHEETVNETGTDVEMACGSSFGNIEVKLEETVNETSTDVEIVGGSSFGNIEVKHEETVNETGTDVEKVGESSFEKKEVKNNENSVELIEDQSRNLNNDVIGMGCIQPILFLNPITLVLLNDVEKVGGGSFRKIMPKETVYEAIKPKETVDEAIKPKETVDEAIKPKEAVDESIKSKETVDESIKPKETVDEVHDAITEDNDCDLKSDSDGKNEDSEELIEDQSLNLNNDVMGKVAKEQKLVLRGRIIGMLEAGKGVNEVARMLGIHRNTVSKWKKRFEKESSLKDRQRPGQPRKTTREQDEAIIQEITRNPFTNASEIKRRLGLPIIDRTVRERLQRAGIHHRVPKTKRGRGSKHVSEGVNESL